MSHLTHSAPSTRPSWYQSSWLRPFNDVAAIEELMQRLRPQATLGVVRARVVSRIDETADTITFELKPNRHWTGFRAGQHVLVTMEIDGQRMQRCFSISSAPGQNQRIAITVKRHSATGVAAAMHARIKVGSVVELSAAFGDFGVESSVSGPVLMLSAGSGITPLMSILRSLSAQKALVDLVFVHSCRTAADLIFAQELRALATTMPGFKLIEHHSSAHGRLDARQLALLVPDFTQRSTLLCGPRAFAEWVNALYQQRGATERLRSEQFSPMTSGDSSEPDAAQSVHCTRSERSFTAEQGQVLLLAAEQAGMSPRHGCRIGICRSCQCRKQSGTVENLLTGEICDEPDRMIQLCISKARSPLTVDL